jgi:hypothetical protein
LSADDHAVWEVFSRIREQSILERPGVYTWSIEQVQTANPVLAALYHAKHIINPTNEREVAENNQNLLIAAHVSATRTNRTELILTVKSSQAWHGTWRYMDAADIQDGGPQFVVSYYCATNLVVAEDLRRRKIVLCDKPMSVLSSVFMGEPTFYCLNAEHEYKWSLDSDVGSGVMLLGQSTSNISVRVSIDKASGMINSILRYYGSATPEYIIERTDRGYSEKILDPDGTIRQSTLFRKNPVTSLPTNYSTPVFSMRKDLFVDFDTKDMQMKNVRSDTLMQ